MGDKNNKKPQAVIEAQQALEKIKGSDALAPEFLARLQKILPILAIQMEQAGEAVNAESLISHIHKGEAHIQALGTRYAKSKPNKKLSYDSILAKWEEEKQEQQHLKEQRIQSLIAAQNIEALQKELGHNTPETTLLWASINGHIAFTKRLIQHSIDTESPHLQLIALQKACTHGHSEIVKLLLDHGADIHAGADEALRNACSYGHSETVKLLLDHGADIHARRDEALRRACSYGDSGTVKLLLDHGADIHAREDEALRHACMNGHSEIVKLLLDHGVDIHAREDEALRHACSRGDSETVKLLLDHGADIHARRDEALRHACSRGDSETVKLLLDHGANIHAGKDIAFRHACAFGHSETVKLLLDHGADIHAKEDEALRRAYKNGHSETIKLLLDHGADIHAIGDQALIYPSLKGHSKTVKLLLDHGADIHAIEDEALRNACMNGHTEIVKLLLDHGADIHAIEDQALRHACLYGRNETVKLLLDHGADIHAIDDAALRHACARRHSEIVILLLDHGVDISRFPVELHEELNTYNSWRQKFSDYSVPLPPDLADKTPYHFEEATYKAIIDIMKREGYNNSTGRNMAYHAAALFKTKERVLQYLKKWGKPGQQPLHDIIQNITVPASQIPDRKAWADAVLKHGPDMARLVKFSDRLAQPLKDGSDGWSYRKTKEEIAQYAYKRGAENPVLSAFCMDHGWDEDDFNDALKQIEKFIKKYASTAQKPAANDNIKGGMIPDVTIKGNHFAKPGYTFRKLPDGDPRGLILGEFTDCCQHLAGEGRSCTKHGFLSAQGGFYVVTDDKSGDIIAQSWAWRGEEGELVLDSLESLSGHFNAAQWTSLCLEFAKAAQGTAHTTGITAILAGTGGATPSDLDFTKVKGAKPVDYNGYRDSKGDQFLIAKF